MMKSLNRDVFSGHVMKGNAFMLFAMIVMAMTWVLTPSQANAKTTDPLVGDWQAYDDKTGMKRSIVRITQNKKTGDFFGRVIKRFNIPGANNNKTCVDCPKPFTNQDVVGMTVMWNLKKDSNKNARYPYQGGYVIDPASGKIYGMKLSVSKNGDMLKGLGYIVGMESLKRRQRWIRIK